MVVKSTEGEKLQGAQENTKEIVDAWKKPKLVC